MKICPLVIWIWNQNIAISTIVGTSSHINSDIYGYGPIIFFQSRPGVDPDFLKIGGPKPKFSVVKGFSPKRRPAPSCRLCTQSGVV